MAIWSAVPVIGRIVDKGLDIVDQFVEDKDQANRIKAAIKKQMEEQAHQERQTLIQEQGKIVTAEIQGESWLQRNWRPLLMLVVILIIANNYIIVPYLSAIFPGHVKVLELPNGLWALLNIGVGGYIGGRTVEKLKGKQNNKIL